MKKSAPRRVLLTVILDRYPVTGAAEALCVGRKTGIAARDVPSCWWEITEETLCLMAQEWPFWELPKITVSRLDLAQRGSELRSNCAMATFSPYPVYTFSWCLNRCHPQPWAEDPMRANCRLCVFLHSFRSPWLCSVITRLVTNVRWMKKLLTHRTECQPSAVVYAGSV